MKKFVCMLLVLMVALSAMAMAEFVPSKTTGDLTQVTVEAEDPTAYEGLMVAAVVTEAVEYEKKIEICNSEIEKLSAAENVVAYFGEVKNASGEVVDILEMLNVEAVNVYEFCPIVASGYTAEMGNVTLAMQFATPYEVDEAVIVLIGLVAEDETVAWTAYEGVVTEDGVKVEFDAEMLLAIQEGDALLAVVSK